MNRAPVATAWAAARVTRAETGHETRTLVLDAAAQVFGQLGYARTTVAHITTAADVSRPTFYAYFASKAEVFAEVAARTRDEFLAAHEVPGVDQSDPHALGRSSVHAFLTAYRANNDLLTVIEHQAISDPTIAEIWAEIQQRPARRVARYIRHLAAEGKAHPAAAPDLVAEAVLGMLARLGRSEPLDPAVFDHRVDALTAIWLRLIGVDAPTP
jgi:TetR/AcrR family transcriptional regulator